MRKGEEISPQIMGKETGMEQMNLFGGLDEKIQRSTDIIKLAADMSEHYYHKPLLIAYSGGKDSEVLADLAIKSGVPIEISNSHTTVDAPETVYHIRKQFAKWRAMGIPCEIRYPTYKGKRTSMWELIPRKGIMPSSWARYCCAVLKETDGKHRLTALGVRNSESVNRANRSAYECIGKNKESSIHKSYEDTAEVYQEDLDDSPYGECRFIERAKKGGKIVTNPIIDWTDDDVWAYIQNNGVTYNPLYDECFRRVGCVGCPLAGGKKMRHEFERWPKYEQLYRRTCRKLYDTLKANGKAFYLTKSPTSIEARNGDEIFEWWINVRR